MRWETVPLGEVARFVRGVTYKPGDVVADGADGVACLRTKNIQSTLDLTDLVHVRSDLKHRVEQRVQEDDVLVSSANSWHLVGRAVQAGADAEGMLIGGFIGGLRFKPDDVSPRYGYYWFSSPAIQARVRSFGQQTTNISNLNVERTLGLPIPLPPLPEQRRIAAILDEADALRSIAKSSVSTAETLAAATFTSMFGLPETWDSHPLGEAVRLYSGGTPSKSNPELWDGDVPWFSPKDMKSQSLYDSTDHVTLEATAAGKLKLLPPDTVTVVVRGMILAHTLPVTRLRVPGTINQDVKALLPRVETDAAFLAGAIRGQSKRILGEVAASGHGTKRLDTAVLTSLPIPRASRHDQLEFRRAVDSVESHLERLGDRVARIDALFASLQHRAFRGEL